MLTISNYIQLRRPSQILRGTKGVNATVQYGRRFAEQAVAVYDVLYDVHVFL